MSRANKHFLLHRATSHRWISSSVPGCIPALLLFCLGVTGCVSVPPGSAGKETTREALAAHIKFLSQPALKGRKPGTHGSSLARQYIESRFKSYGLVPWRSERNYELSFGYGKNVVGVVPGSDTNLATEIVLLSAHYDHLGKQKGRIYPGASDNASGVAALLETAKRMSQHRPKRTVAFVAFDCEEQMLLGSFAFSCRTDVAGAKIVAVVNVDMLGRDFLDAVRNTVFVSGTEQYPGLREQVCRFGTNANIRVLPLGSDLIGPRSDHVAFESREIPCLFFSCGSFRDYHEPTDTAEKLNYTGIERAANVIFESVKELADSEEKRATNGSDFDPEELRTVSVVLSEVDRNSEQAGIKKEDIESFRKLESAAENLLRNGRYDREAREKLVIEATGTLVPYLMPVGDLGKGRNNEQQKQMMVAMQYLQCFYLNYRRQIMDGYQKLVAHLLKYHPGPFRGMPDFEHEVYDIADDDIRVAETGRGTYALNALVNQLTLKAEIKSSKWLFKSFNIVIFASATGIDCEGTREQLADCCLLRLRGEQTNAMHSEKIKKVLRAVSGTEPNGDYKEVLQERLERGGFKDETEWMEVCILSGIPELALEGIGAAGESHEERIRSAACRIVTNRNIRSDVRAAAIELAANSKDRKSLFTLCDVLDDTSPAYKAEYMPQFQEGYPFAERMAVKILRLTIEDQMKHSPDASKTLGDLARQKLKKATGRDYAKDAKRWREWVEAHVNA